MPPPESKSAKSTPGKAIVRCSWCVGDDRMTRYHDEEWGVPLRDDRRLFEFLILETMQAGLSWKTILHKREHFRRAFAGFDPEKVARFTDKRKATLMLDAGIIRNRQKIDSAVGNARAFLKIQQQYGSFAEYSWRFVSGKPKVNRWRSMKQIPAVSAEAEALSKDLKRAGFRFVGPTIIYAHMQATGMVNDHAVNCFRHATCGDADPDVSSR